MVGILSVMFFLVGIIFTTNAGNYWLDVIDGYCASINLLVIGGFQYIVIAWLFGAKNWMNELEWMVETPGQKTPILITAFK